MKLKLFVTDEAEREIQVEHDWYEVQANGLGAKLVQQIDEALQLICNYPLSFPCRRRDYRECRVSGFPYLIIYRIVKDRVIMHQLFHVRRHPRKKVR